MATSSDVTTAQQLLETNDLGRCELIDGALIMMSPAGFEHGRIVARITRRLSAHVESHDLGIVTGAETGFVIRRDPDTVRAPDVAFVRNDRVPAEVVQGFFEGAPDLAVEVLSPDDRPGAVTAKVQDWLQSGCLSVWIVDPGKRTVNVIVPDGPALTLAITEHLSAEPLLPNLSISVQEIFG